MKNSEKLQKFIIVAIVLSAILLISITASIIKRNSNSNKEIPDSKSEIASSQIGKTVDESEIEFETAELVPNSSSESSDTQNVLTENTISNEVTSNDLVTNTENTDTSNKIEEKELVKETSNNEVTFIAPVSGTILRDFAKDSLVYSETLKEWITHTGVDIKADKTSVVSSAANGTVYAIKNDPRYGLTVIINHDNGFQTIYSNLLTAEFVVEGETVKQGQSIGTVGNTAPFEILDDYHLHFELLKDNEYLDPTIYISFE